ncbi:MAG TPA: LPS assembly lipoprotein LptE [Steroidobacteraceae bacterium]|nr:LPS assembly lipoprotein LptE [Steroidobacteraceae bacterium]
MLTACGWHLQGAAHLPAAYSTLHIESDDAYSDFYVELRRSLVASGVRVMESSENAHATIRVIRENAGQRVAAVSKLNTPEEFQVFYTADYSVSIDGAEVMPSQHLELTSNFSYDPNLVLAKEREQRTIQRALARELANTVMRRLAVSAPTK